MFWLIIKVWFLIVEDINEGGKINNGERINEFDYCYFSLVFREDSKCKYWY